MTDDNIKGSEFLENALKTQGAIDAALRPPTFDDFTGQGKTSIACGLWSGAALTDKNL